MSPLDSGPENNYFADFDPAQRLTPEQDLAAHNTLLNQTAIVLGQQVVRDAVENRMLRDEFSTLRVENDYLQEEVTSLRATTADLTKENAALDKQANLNPVSLFYNERGLQRHFDALVEANPGVRLAVIAIDLGSFKAVNDELGHHEGDKLLARVGNLFRISDLEAIVANPHGDEFVVITPLDLPTEDEQGESESRKDRSLNDEERIAAIIDRLKGHGAALTLQDQRLADLGFSISAGGIIHEPGTTLKQTLEMADAAMYRDKQESLPELSAENTADIEALREMYASLAARGIPKRLADKYLKRYDT